MSYTQIQYDLESKSISKYFDTNKTSVTFSGLTRNKEGVPVQTVHVVGTDTLQTDVDDIISSLVKKDKKIKLNVTHGVNSR